MRRFLLTVLLLLLLGTLLMAQAGVGDVNAEDGEDENFFEKNVKFTFTLTNDFMFLTFPAATEEYIVGNIDEDLPSFVDNLGMGTTEFFADKLGYKDTYWIRTDLYLQASLTPKATLYYLMAIRVLNQDSGIQDDFNYLILQCEIEQKIGDMYKLRMGRLIEKYSKSRFFGRIAQGGSDSHVFGRTPFVNDAVEITVNSDKAKFPLGAAIGMKYKYKPIDYSALYVTPHFEFPFGKNSFGGYYTYSLIKQQYEDLKPLFPSFDDDDHDRFYHAMEAELAFNFGDIVTPYANMGFLMDYVGVAPHFSGPRDILRGNEPIIDDSTESISETMTTAFGISLAPSSITGKLDFFKEALAEFEFAGMGNDIKANNFYGHLRFEIKNITFHYGLYRNHIVSDEMINLNDSGGNIILAADELNIFEHFIRITTTF